jgi:hypothetical protein
MTLPAVNITQIDGALGVTPPSSGKLLAIVGVAEQGPTDTPAAFARTKDVVSTFGKGPMPEFAAYALKTFGRPVVLVRTGQSVLGTHSNLNVAGVTGTSVVTIDDGDETPNDDYEPYMRVTKGGTIGVAGIELLWSLDGGRTLSARTALGVANTFAVPGAGGIGYDFGAGTLVAGDFWTSRATAPRWNTTELGSALTALKNTTHNWGLVLVAGPIDAAAFDELEVQMTGLMAAGKFRGWIGNTRVPNVGETEAQYKTALDGIFSAKSTIWGSLYAGAAKTLSGVDSRSYRRPVALAAGALESSVDDDVNIADLNLGSVKGVTITDVNGNPEDHDEAVFPGLDDSRFGTLRTVETAQGTLVAVTRPRIFSAAGSDFTIMPYRRVMNLFGETLRQYFLFRLNKPVLVSKATGKILETDRLEIQRGARKAAAAVLLAKPKASDVEVIVSKDDLILSTKTLTVTARLLPLGYPEFIELEIGFVNPALQLQLAA